MRSLFRNRWLSRPQRQSDLFDVFHPRTMSALTGLNGRTLCDWSAADVADVETAPRFILGLLRSSSNLRERFPRALSEEQYHDWLVAGGAKEQGVSAADIGNVEAAFAAQPGEQIRQYHLHGVELQSRFPFALLPVGQKRFVNWLLGKGAMRHSFSDEAILWFLHKTSEDLAAGIAETYLIHPSWQEQFPDALSSPKQRQLLKWLQASFPRYRPFRTVKTLPLKPSLSDGAGVNLLAHFCYPSGLQRAALSAKSALEHVGMATSCRDVPAGVQTQLADRRNWLGLEIFPVSLLSIAPLPYFTECYRRAGLHARPGVYRVASWYWELETIPPEWSQLAHFAEEIWAPTPFVADAMRTTMPLPVFEMLPAVSLGPIEAVSRASLGIAEDNFLFFFMFDMCSEMERKNPLGLIRAFRRAFSPGEKATLLIKTMRSEADAKGWERLQTVARENQVLLLDELMSDARVRGLMASSDCFVSLHRSEGFGLGLAEAMLLGKPVIATNYSGNLAFMNPANSLLVDYELTPIETSGPIYKSGNVWANPSEEHAAQLMRDVFLHRESAFGRAEKARTELSCVLSLQAAGERMKSRLEAIRDAMR